MQFSFNNAVLPVSVLPPTAALRRKFLDVQIAAQKSKSELFKLPEYASIATASQDNLGGISMSDSALFGQYTAEAQMIDDNSLVQFAKIIVDRAKWSVEAQKAAEADEFWENQPLEAIAEAVAFFRK